MHKLTILTLVAVAMLSQAGCCQGWPRWFTRGDSCSMSNGGCGYGNEMGGDYQGMQGFQGGQLLPPNVIPQNQVMPGPQG